MIKCSFDDCGSSPSFTISLQVQCCKHHLPMILPATWAVCSHHVAEVEWGVFITDRDWDEIYTALIKTKGLVADKKICGLLIEPCRIVKKSNYSQ